MTLQRHDDPDVRQVVAKAARTFGSEAKASRWLRRPTAALNGAAPIDLLETASGIVEVTDLLHRIDYGLAV